MARPLRLEFPGAVYHVTSRGNQRQEVYPDDEHRCVFLDILHAALHRFNMVCHAYCLMDNHYHLLIETPDGNLSKGMRQINAVYTQHFNRKTKSCGHLFQGRYKSIVVEKDAHLLEAIRYLMLNPVRSGMVANAADYRWSSYRGTCGIEPPHPCLSTEWLLGMFGGGMMAVGKFREFVQQGAVSDSPWCRAKGQVILGSDAFCAALEPALKGVAGLNEVPVSQRLAMRPDLQALFHGAGKQERNAGIREAVDRWGYAQIDVARFLGLHYSTVSRILTLAGEASSATPAADPPKQRAGVGPAKRKKVEKKVEKKDDPQALPQLSLF